MAGKLTWLHDVPCIKHKLSGFKLVPMTRRESLESSRESRNYIWEKCPKSTWKLYKLMLKALVITQANMPFQSASRKREEDLHHQAFSNVTFNNNKKVQNLLKMYKLHLSCVGEYGLIMNFILLGPYQCKRCKMLKLTAVVWPDF